MQMSPLLPSTSSKQISIHAQERADPTFIQSSRFVIESWLLLFHLELVMKFQNSQTLREIVRTQQVRTMKRPNPSSSEAISHAMDLACVFYFKRVLCLQRSAATTLLLRRHGWTAEMVTGAQILPPEFHAWVEIGDVIVNDKPYMREIYQVLERC
jgi:hypothetical protein